LVVVQHIAATGEGAGPTPDLADHTRLVGQCPICLTYSVGCIFGGAAASPAQFLLS
jgi:hypothetical protein